MKSYQGSNGPFILAHRGGADEATENTMAAFQHAVNVGMTHLEKDVRASADGTLYLCHGATSVMPNQPLSVRPEHTPLTLSALFDAFPDHFFAIDPKHDRTIEPLAKLIAGRGLQDQVCIGSSFDRRTERTAAPIEQLRQATHNCPGKHIGFSKAH